jgi:hypothetical protein
MAKYDYVAAEGLKQCRSVEEAVHITVVNLFHHQLGWSLNKCEERVEKELNREIPKDSSNIQANGTVGIWRTRNL